MRFDVKTLLPLFQDFCEEEWRKSRLEIDCAKGDGLNFIAPKGSRCNPFSSRSEGKYCVCCIRFVCSSKSILTGV